VVEHALTAVDSYEAAKRLVRIEDGKELVIGDLRRKLSEVQNIYVLGGGKAAYPIARWLDETLGERITEGVIAVKRGETRRLRHVQVREAGHPMPDQDGLNAAKEIMKTAKKAQEGDIVLCIVTGGLSALAPLPAKGITLSDKKKVTGLLLKCGATIDEINAVRKHISQIKGGRLAKYLHPAEIVNLIVIDEVAGLPWGPCVPDTTTFFDAIHALQKYALWGKIPESVKRHLEKGMKTPNAETPKPKDFQHLKVHNLVLADNRIACERAMRRSQELGLSSVILSTVMEGESREVGVALACIAKEVNERKRPVETPCTLIVGGETTVTIEGRHGKGGPNQELVLGFSLKAASCGNVTLVSIGTDGTDGPTEIAGGIADGYTLRRAEEKRIDVYKDLIWHNSSRVLRDLGDAIITGQTETNVMSLQVVVIS